MFYNVSITVSKTDTTNLIKDFIRNRWAVIDCLQVEVDYSHTDIEDKVTLEFKSSKGFPFELIKSLNTVSTVDFKCED